MDGEGPTITRRRLLRDGGIGVLGLAASGSLGVAVVEAFGARNVGPPATPSWHSRPDLRIPALSVTRRERAASRWPIFIAPYNKVNAQAGAVIADDRGEPVFEQPLAYGTVTTNFRVQRYLGSPVLSWWEGKIELGHGVGEYVIADSSYRTIRRVQAAKGLRGDLHEFVITPRQTALLTSYRVTQADLRSVGGSRRGSIQDAIFQEIDLASGELLLEWHSLGGVSLEESYVPVSEDWDFFHINSVDLDLDGNLLVSSRSTHTVYKVDRKGEILWRLGGKTSDFELGPGAGFAWQHDVRRRPDGRMTIFDNGATPAVEARSRALILDLDEQQMRATLVAQYAHRGVLAGSQGSVQLLPDGKVFVGWGEVPRVSEFDRDGRIVFDALLGSEYQSYRAFRQPWSGLPSEAPAIAVRGRGRGTTVYASWNGATGVERWQLQAGEQAGSLRAVASAPASGFETAIQSPVAGPHFAVLALDASGTTLGRSAEGLASDFLAS
jgi:hypothetical protein